MIDDIDKKIIDLLVSSGREPATSISEKVGLSVPSITERIKKLQENGIISGFKAVVNYKNLEILEIKDDIKYLYALSWSRFGNVTLYKYNSEDEEFVVQ